MSYKEVLLSAFSSLLKNDSLSGNSLVFVTAAGTVQGSICVNPDKCEDPAVRTFLSFERKTRDDFSKESLYPCLPLENAVLTTVNGVEISYKFLCLFPDDIIAISVAESL